MKKIRVGVIGCGHIAGEHVRGYQVYPKEVEVVALMDNDKKTVSEKQSKWNVTNVFKDYEDLIDSGIVDAVSVCTPNIYHAPVSIYALNKGIHVLCEKPIVTNIKDAELMIKIAKKKQLVLQVCHFLRHSAYVNLIKKYIEKGNLGKVLFIRARMAHNWGGCFPTSWFTNRDLSGGGTLLDNGCHYLDLFRYLIGDVSRVGALTSNFAFKSKCEDTAVAIMRFKNGAIGELETSWAEPSGWSNIMSVYGNKALINYTQDFVGGFNEHVEYIYYKGHFPKKIDLKPRINKDPYILQIRNFLNAIKGKEDVKCSGFDGMKSLGLALNCYESKRRQSFIRVK